MSSNISKIFLSSIFEDSFHIGFKRERDKLGEYLNSNNNFKVINLDNDMAELGDTTRNSLEAIEKSDFVILFLGTTYGSIRTDIPEEYKYLLKDNKHISLTHLEYRYAMDKGIPVTVFIFPMAENYNFPDDGKKGNKEDVESFIKEVNDAGTSSYICRYSNLFDDIIEYKKKGIYCPATEQSLPIEMYLEILGAKISYNVSRVLYENILKKLNLKDFSLQDNIKNADNYVSIVSDIDKDKPRSNEQTRDKNCSNWRIYDDLDMEDNHFYIVTHVTDEYKLNREKIRNKIIEHEEIDSKYLYINPESVEVWSRWEREKGQDSQDAFNVFLKSKTWLEKLQDIDTIVDLGVGTGDSTSKILKSIDSGNTGKNNKIIKTVIVDSSIEMIDFALQNLKKISTIKNIRYTVDGFKTDFMDLILSKKRFLQGKTDYHTAFFMIGGTMGNINEAKFMNSFKKICNPGDLLVLGIFKVQAGMKKFYDEDKNMIRDMYNPSLRDFNINILEIENKEITNVINGIKGTKCIDIYAKVEDTLFERNDKFLLKCLSSKRYDYEQFKNFIESYNFSFIGKEEDYITDNKFTYLTFERS